MYIVKNALKCISRAKGRNILIGVIVFAIALSACLGLSIRQAAENAKSETLDGMSVTATISFDRQSMMSEMRGQPPQDGEQEGGFDREQFAEMMGESSALTLEEYKTYATASSVKDFYYELSASLNGSDSFEPVSTDTESDTETDSESSQMPEFGGSMGDDRGMGGGRMMMAQSDFNIIGYSGESAMTSFVDGTASITDGTVFDEGSKTAQCIITEELAAFNDIEVGDKIKLTNPNNEDEVYKLKVTGIYTDTESNEDSFSIMGATATDPANKIYMSYAALQNLLDDSAEQSQTLTDENTGREYTTEIQGSLNATYVFADVDAYNLFEEEVRELGLDESYTVSSSDITAFESRLVPLETLSTMAGYFLIVILVIGAIILIVLNIFNVRERKYEIGVLTAMGMKKGKVAMQFLTEIFVVTLAAVIIGAGIGAVSSVPVTNALLANQVSSVSDREEQIEMNFGRGQGENSNLPQGGMQERPQGMNNFFGGAVDYITEIDSAMNLTVVLQMLGIAVALTLAAGAVSMLFVMRYDPLKILANRD